MPHASRDRPTVLIVEDSGLIRGMADEYLQEANFRTLTAETVSEAIALLETRPDIRCAFIDIRLDRDIRGTHLVAVIRDRWPPVEMILTSAYYAAEQVVVPERVQFISKPYSLAHVARVFRTMLP